MKNQYFGDINDYRKYGILRCLAEVGVAVGVHWMLTPDDSGADGGKLEYLESPGRWRHCDPPLFDVLSSAVTDGVRDVRAFEESGLLPGARFFSDATPDRGDGRLMHFGRASDALAPASLIFFDPDNGIEIPSTPIRATGSCKFIYWRELGHVWRRGQSLLVFQHYPRVARPAYEARLSEACRCLMATPPFLLRTGNVLFLLLVQPDHSELAGAALAALQGRWRGQVDVADPANPAEGG